MCSKQICMYARMQLSYKLNKKVSRFIERIVLEPRCAAMHQLVLAY